MRNLTQQQKRLLEYWFDNNYPSKTGYCKFGLVEKIDIDTFQDIEVINPSEVFWQEADNYLESLVK